MMPDGGPQHGQESAQPADLPGLERRAAAGAPDRDQNRAFFAHGQDVAGQLYHELSAVAEVPPPPAQGTLDIQVVRDSRYFFS